jgi:hypothetical protein
VLWGEPKRKKIWTERKMGEKEQEEEKSSLIQRGRPLRRCAAPFARRKPKNKRKKKTRARKYKQK